MRKTQGRIRSLDALCEDLDLRLVNKRVFESLTKAGAFDSLAQGTGYAGLPSLALRPRLLAAIDAACEHGARAQRDRDQGQAQLFGAERRRAGQRRGDGGGGTRFPRPRRGPRPSSSASRRKRSASTGAATRSIATPPR